MKPHRVFIAINLPEGVKTELLAYQERWLEFSASSADRPARWTTKENMHLTIAFLGNTSDAEIAEVCELMQKVGERHKPFTLAINRIVYGPDVKRPRMVWALVGKSLELLNLQRDIEKTLGQHGNEPFSPHLTLARIRAFELQRMELEELPDVNEGISVSFQVQSIEVMESKLKRSGAEYTVVQSFMLQR